MSKRKWEQIGAAGGIAFVVLQGAAQSLIQIGGAEPSFNAPAQEVATFFENRNPQLFGVGSIMSALSAVAFLWFLGVLWATLRRHEGEPAWMSLVAFGSGLVGVAVSLTAGGGWELAMLRIDQGLAPGPSRLAPYRAGLAGSAWQWRWPCSLPEPSGPRLL
jgi:hypothetical protein